MDDAEDNEAVGRRKRRSVRLRRRSGIPLVPFNIALDTDHDAIPKEEDAAIAVPKEEDVYGSLWMDTKEPAVKKKKRRSSMFIGYSAIDKNSEKKHEQNDGDFVPGLVESSEILSFKGSSICINSQNSSSIQFNRGNEMSTAEINVDDRTSPLTEDPFDEESAKSRTENLGKKYLKSTKDINAGTPQSNISTKSVISSNSSDCLDTEQTLTSRSPLISDAFTPPAQSYSDAGSPSSMSPEYPESPEEHLNKTSHEDSYLASAFGKVVGKVVEFVKTSPSYLFGVGTDSSKTEEASASPILNRRPGESDGPVPVLSMDKHTEVNGSKDVPSSQEEKAELETSSSTKDKREVFFDTHNLFMKVFQGSPVDKDTGRKSAETCAEMDSDDKMEGQSKDLANTKDLSLPSCEVDVDENKCISMDNKCSKPVNNTSTVTDQPNTNNDEVSIDENCKKSDFNSLQNKRETDNLKENEAGHKELSSNSTENELCTDVDTCYTEGCVSEGTMSFESIPDINKFNTNHNEINHVSETTESNEVNIDIIKVTEKRKDLIDNGMTENISTKEQPTVNTGSEEIATPNSGAEEHLTDKISIAKLAMEIADISQLLADNACAEELPRDNVISKELPGDKASTKKNITENVTSSEKRADKVSIYDVLTDTVNINVVLTNNESNIEIQSQNVSMNEEHSNKQNTSNTKTIRRKYKRRSKEYTTLRTKDHISSEKGLQTIVEDLDDQAQTELQKKANKDIVLKDSNSLSSEDSSNSKNKIHPSDKLERSELQDCNKKATTTNSRKRKAEGDIFDIEKVYLNKIFVKPEEHRPWHTILESPDRYGDTIGKKRLQRFINFEKPTLAKLRRRQQRAKKNGWDTNPKKRKILADEEVKDKLSVLWAELDHSQPDSPSLHDQLKQFVETD